MLYAEWSLARKPVTILAGNSSGKFHELDHVEDEGDKADELALLPLIVGVARWPEHHMTL